MVPSPMQTSLREDTGVVATREELIALGPPRTPSRTSTGRRVVTALAGQHSAKVHGAGMAFSEVRAYQAGDDMRSIDWRVSARTGQLHSKLFEAERERPLLLSVDLGRSMQFATRGTFKSVAAARAASCIAWDAFGSGERVGAVISCPSTTIELPAGRTRRHLMRIFDALARGTASPPGGRVDDGSLSKSLEWIRARARTGSRVFVLSDFYRLDDAALGILAAVARRCELGLVWIYDTLEATAPPAGRYVVSDGVRRELLIARKAPQWREAYCSAFNRREAQLREFARSHRATLIPLRTDTPVERSSRGHGVGAAPGGAS